MQNFKPLLSRFCGQFDIQADTIILKFNLLDKWVNLLL